MARTRYQSQRHAINAGKHVRGAALHLFNPRHGKAWRVHAIHTTGGQQVTHRNIRIGRHKPQFDGVGMDRVFTVGHTPCTRARIEHGRSVVMVCNQSDFAGQRIQTGDLAQHSQVINHRGAQGQALDRTFVQNDFSGVRIGSVVNRLGCNA